MRVQAAVRVQAALRVQAAAVRTAAKAVRTAAKAMGKEAEATRAEVMVTAAAKGALLAVVNETSPARAVAARTWAQAVAMLRPDRVARRHRMIFRQRDPATAMTKVAPSAMQPIVCSGRRALIPRQ